MPYQMTENERTAEVMRLAAEGRTAQEIAKTLKIGLETTRRELHEAERIWLQESVRDYEIFRSKTLQTAYRYLSESFEAFERSKGATVEIIEEERHSRPKSKSKQADEAPLRRSSHVTRRILKESPGDPAYLQHVNLALSQIRAIGGIDVTRIAMTDPTGQRQSSETTLAAAISELGDRELQVLINLGAKIEKNDPKKLCNPEKTLEEAEKDPPENLQQRASFEQKRSEKGKILHQKPPNSALKKTEGENAHENPASMPAAGQAQTGLNNQNGKGKPKRPEANN